MAVKEFFETPLCKFHNFWGMSGSEDRGGGDNSIQFINFGSVGDNSFKEWRQKIGDGRVGDNSISTFCPIVLDKKCHFPAYSYTRLIAYALTYRSCILGNFVYSYL